MMKVLVCISQVPDTTSKVRFKEGNTQFDTADIQYVMGPYDELALTRILEVRDAGTPMEITVVNVGDASTENTIRKAVAVGANHAVRIDAKPTDAFYVASQLAAFAKGQGFDLIVTGKEASDYNGNQVGEMLAELLDIPSISNASHIEVKGGKVVVEREMGGGKETVIAPTPFMVAGQKGFAIEPRIPAMRGIMQARKTPIKVVPAVPAEHLLTVESYELPPAKSGCKFVPKDQVDELVRLLHEEAKVL